MKEMTFINIIESNGNLQMTTKRNLYFARTIVCSQKNFTTAGKQKKPPVLEVLDLGSATFS